ncbi:MAG: cation transporting ATPase C-terminal domain-containing protein, partial [Candidatus Woesearchaeota archaeon]
GRTIFDNIQRFITYILTSNMAQMIPFLLYVLFPIPLAITVIQILAIDILTNVIPAIGLGNESSESDTMHRKPRRASQHLVTHGMFMRSYGLIGPLTAVCGFITFFLVLYMHDWRWGVAVVEPYVYYMATVAFLGSVIFCQIGNVFACRSTRQSAVGLLRVRNTWITWGVLLAAFFMSAITALPFLFPIFHSYYLPWYCWLCFLIYPFVIFFAEELRKYAVRCGVRWLDTQ